MKALLVYPDHPDTFWSFRYALKFISKKANHPPLGLLTIAPMLPEDWEKKLVDMRVDSLTDEDIKWADCVLVSAMSVQRESARNVVDRCKGFGVRVVAGGPLFTNFREDFDDVDHLILNEAEITLPVFLKDLENGEAKHLYETGEFPEMEETPIPMWDLIDMKKYAHMSIQYSRGCPFNCEFCNVTSLFGHKIRTKSKEQILAELESIYSQGWRDWIFVVDDNFIGNRGKLKREILPAMIGWMEKRNYPFSFGTQVSIDLSDDAELMDLMVKAGFGSVFVGIETPDEENLLECGKAQNRNRDLIESVKKLQRAGIEVQAGFIVGFDHDTPSIFEKMKSFIQQSGIAAAMIGLLNAPPDTRLFRRLESENRLLAKATGDNTDLSMNFVPKMDSRILIDGYKDVIETVYSPDWYSKRLTEFFREYRLPKTRRLRPSFMYLSGFLKSIFFLGIKEKERSYYWKFLFWSLFRHPRMLPVTVSLSVSGFNLRKTVEDYLRDH